MNKLIKALLLVLILYPATIYAQQNSSEVVTLEGQLVCSECWFEADRKTTPYGDQADITCAQECAEKGIPSAIAVKEGDTHRLYLIEIEKLKSKALNWLDLIGKQVRVSGQLETKDKKQYVSLDTLIVTGENPFRPKSQSLVGREVNLTLKDLFGKDQSVSDYRGRILVLNFWATWCIPCKTEMPDLVAIQNEYAAFGVQVVGASADELADREKVVKFIREVRINFPVWLGMTTDDMKRFGVGPSLPATVVIGRDGKILQAYPGVIKAAELRKLIDKQVAQSEVNAKQEIASTKPVRAKTSTVPS